ncbi:MAG TPA: hypothetical protein VHZ78_10870 [Rhizomicrobium sp.]|jgi:hypothetical protein|nr:hypothetical protein [Rhizomicrobium sp.]
MTNIYNHPGKRELKRHLFDIAVQALETEGWKVERLARGGGSSVRMISRPGEQKKVSIRTSQDTWIAFPRDRNGSGWITLSDVDAVVAVSVNDSHNPTEARVHLIDGDEMRDRFDRAYAARKRAKYALPEGRGIWVSLYLDEAAEPPTLVGAGAGNVFPPIARVPLNTDVPSNDGDSDTDDKNEPAECSEQLTIAEAKRRLALTLGVSIANIKITIEG